MFSVTYSPLDFVNLFSQTPVTKSYQTMSNSWKYEITRKAVNIHFTLYEAVLLFQLAMLSHPPGVFQMNL